MENKVIQTWKLDNPLIKKQPQPISVFLEKFQSPQKIRDKLEASNLARKSTEKERKRYDTIASLKKKVLEAKKKKKDQKVIIKSSPKRVSKSPSRSPRSKSPSRKKSLSPPASGYKYTTFEPEKLLEEGLRKQDDYIIKNALKRDAKVTAESVPSLRHLFILMKYKTLSKDEWRNFKQSIIRTMQDKGIQNIPKSQVNQYTYLLSKIEDEI
jgi:hypothetical protein